MGLLELFILILLICWLVGLLGPWPAVRQGGLIHLILVLILVVVVLRVLGVVL